MEQPVAAGRVNAIKSRFENLSTHLDISKGGLSNINNNDRNSNVKLNKNSFQRSATSIEIFRKSENVNKDRKSGSNLLRKNWNTSSNNKTNVNEPSNHNSSLLSLKKKSDLAITNNKSIVEYSKINKLTKHTKIFEEDDIDNESKNVLSRQSSDPIKRSSIKRSPAFRVNAGISLNEKCKIAEENQDASPPMDIAFNNKKFENFINKKYSTDNKSRQLQQTGLTDSLRWHLKQPLPNGPPPQKPPRLFATSSSDDELIQSEKIKLKDKIKKIETNLLRNEKTKIKKMLSPPPAPPFLQKSKTELVLNSSKFSTASKLLDCISCHKNISNIYDINENKPLLQNGNKIKRFSNSVKPLDSPIYMEPFSHLKNKKLSNSNGIEDSREQKNNQAVEQSICSCPEHHSSNEGGDVHYLCTPIEDNIEESESTDGNISLRKTYDEITILVDAAFQQKTSDSDPNLLEGSNSEKKNKLTRSLTEKRKDYVRRIAIIPKENYGTLHQTFKSPVIRTFSTTENESLHSDLIDLKNEKLFVSVNERIQQLTKQTLKNDNLETNNEGRSGNSSPYKNNNIIVEHLSDNLNKTFTNTQKSLFQVCILVGLNTTTNSTYLKLQYPEDEQLPDNIEQLIFPTKNFIRTKENQEYIIILTDNNGFKIYGYCRRVLPEDFDMCLPLCYCIITENKSLGFYQKLLKSIETRHGQSEQQLKILLRNLQKSELPSPGKYLHIKLPTNSILRPKTLFASNHKISPKRLSLETNPKWLTDSKLLLDTTKNQQSKNTNSVAGQQKSLIEEFEVKKQQQQQEFNLINRSLIVRDPRFDEILIRRPHDSRLENIELSELLEFLDIDLVLIIFSTLLLERKVILQSKINISSLTKCILALQTILYPFKWNYNIITVLPEHLIELCMSPCPLIAGVLVATEIPFEIEDGILIDLDKNKILQCCNDEQTILPDSLFKSLKLSLKMIDLIDQGKMLSSVLISEAFLRFFIELFSLDYNDKQNFHKEEFIQSHKSQNIKFFLEWFVETSMFRHFCQEKFEDKDNLDFYNLFNARLMEKTQNQTKTIQNIETIVKNSKIINNKKRKTFKERFKDFLHNY